MNNSAMRLLEILELFAESTEPMTVSDVTKKLGYPKTSVFDIITILASRGFIRHTGDRAKTYVIGPKAYTVGMAYLSGTDLYSVAHPILQNLRDILGETCYLAVPDGASIIYLDKLESQKPIRSTCNIGAVNHMYLTGLGKAMLAGMPEETLEAVVKSGFTAKTAATITSEEGLRAELAAIRERGCAYDMGEDNAHVRCAAAPVRDFSGEVVAAISVSMLDAAFTPEMQARASELIIEAASDISMRLGYRRGKLYL